MAESVERLRAALAHRYRVERELGAGGMARVYLAEDRKHHRRIALKVLRPEIAEAIGTARFLQEIALTAQLQHPHILPLFDSGEADGQLYYAMPYIAGETLRDRLTREGALPVESALAIAHDIAAALTFAHRHGVVHRDVKPENILIDDGEALVADFGIARAAAGEGDARLTGTGISIGTPAYMSPEQLVGQPDIDGRSDVYALACVLFEMLTGRPPFVADTTPALVALAIASEAPRASSLRPDLPRILDDALARALEKDRADRFASPREFLDACSASPAPHGNVASTGRGNRRLTALALGAAAVVVGVLGLVAWRQRAVAAARADLPRIAALAAQQRYAEAYGLAVDAERWIAGDSTLTALLPLVSDRLTVRSAPAGAAVVLERLASDGSPVRTDAGRTPLVELRIPRADHRVLLQRDGYAPVERLASSALLRSEDSDGPIELTIVMDSASAVPDDMLAVPGGAYTMIGPDLPLDVSAELAPFLIDRTEVSNADYREFVRSGEAPPAFTDRSGLPGPRSWRNQEPPAGRERHPVTDVSWHEAQAYCVWKGRRLPTMFEWEKAARDGQRARLGVIMPWGYASAAASDAFRANFAGDGTVAVDAHPFGISPYGAYEMAGNVKEWLANRVADGRGVIGGSWQDPAYLFPRIGGEADSASAASIGFRCAKTREEAADGDQGAAIPLPATTPPVYQPVDAATFRTLLAYYRYDPRAANPRGRVIEETADWTRERVWIDGVGRDSVLAYLWLPKRSPAPYQALVYVASSSAFFFETVAQQIESDLAPHIKAGRAVLGVVLYGMLERPAPAGSEPPEPETVGFRDLMVRHATEVSLAVDWLVARPDIDSSRVAYVGLSFGAGSRLAFAAVDDRYKAAILIGAGIDERLQPTLPEAANFNFAPYIDVPKLMVNGRSDEEHPWLTRALPLWNLLREPKELVLIDGAGHRPLMEDRVPAINRFLDRVLGPVATSAPPDR